MKSSVPRFTEENGFTTSAERSVLMSKIRSTETKCELLFRKALWKKGIRYRINVKMLPGTPDIVIRSKKVIVFIDGEFWHGYNWEDKKPRIKTNRDFWVPKIERNMERDFINTKKLQEMGFKVFRFWEKQVKKELEKVVNEVVDYINEKDSG